jgi:hypothetical protein
VICVNCSALPGPPNGNAQVHSAYHPATINGIVDGNVTYATGPHHQVFEDGFEEGLGRQSPQDSVPKTVSFDQWFMETVCHPLHAILQRGRSSQVIVLFYDDKMEDRSVAMSHLFACSIPTEYNKVEKLLSIARPCMIGCSECSSTQARQLRAVAEDRVVSMMEQSCFCQLTRHLFCKMSCLPWHPCLYLCPALAFASPA